MARLPYVDPATAPERVRDTLAKLPAKLKIFHMMAHAETNFAPMLRFGTSILAEQELDARLRELAILLVAKLSAAPYEWIQHVPIAKAVGATEEEIGALDVGAIEARCFEPRARLVLRFTTEVVRDVRASDATFAAMAKEFTPREIVELIVAIGYYMTMARLMESTGVDLDDPKGATLYEQAQRYGSKRRERGR